MKNFKHYFTVFLFTLVLVACNRVPITGRRQVNLLPESTMVSMSLDAYSQFLQQNPPLPDSDPNAQLVNKVGNRIANAVNEFMKSNNQKDLVDGYKWEFHVVNDKTVNAWCMPGGKVVVYTGILPYTQDETGLAFVMGHEIAHAVARHGNERMSQGLVAQLGGMALDVALAKKSQETRQLFMTAYGLGATVGVILPFSRAQESEADKLGLVFMAMAGYNPSVAPEFWRRMSQSGGPKPPEFLSTHPSDEHRIKDIEKFMPKAMAYYNKASTAEK